MWGRGLKWNPEGTIQFAVFFFVSMNMNKPLNFILILIFAGWSCQTEPDSATLIDQMVVSTNYDPEVNFKTYSTYAIPTDTIGFVSNRSSDTVITSPGSDFPRQVLNAIKKNMDGRGYVKVNRAQIPDIGINVMVVNDFNVFQQVVYPDFYGSRGNYYSGYYGYGSYYSYPYVNTYVNTYAYNTGVLIIEMVDLKNKTPDNKVRVIWDAYMGDVYSTIDRIAQSRDAIDQAFIQSPYIGK